MASMKRLPFKKSATASIGIELEFQLIDSHYFTLISRSKDLIRSLKESAYRDRIKPEITQGMIEINSSIHHYAKEAYQELIELRNFLKNQTEKMDISICGGGTHPFQRWSMQKIFPTLRYKRISNKFRYLSKRATVFGQHVHVGCPNGDDAIYLTHAFARYVPQFIAISASSPFYQGIDTGYVSSRATIFNGFPQSGVIPFLTDWQAFSDYFYKMRRWEVIESMKDFYWDIRPKPEFGTVEIRVFDTPLTIKKAIIIAAYIQTLAVYLLKERPIKPSEDLYHLYMHNRFHACRYGLDGTFTFAENGQQCSIADDILTTLKKIIPYTEELDNSDYIEALRQAVINKKTDAVFLKETLKQAGSFPTMVAEQCRQWLEDK